MTLGSLSSTWMATLWVALFVFLPACVGSSWPTCASAGTGMEKVSKSSAARAARLRTTRCAGIALVSDVEPVSQGKHPAEADRKKWLPDVLSHQPAMDAIKLRPGSPRRPYVAATHAQCGCIWPQAVHSSLSATAMR